MTLREKIARALAKVQTDSDPDTRVFSYEPARIGNGYRMAPDPSTTAPLYIYYLRSADVVIATIMKEFETAGIIVAWPKDAA